jgi:spermidine synthase
MSDNRSEFLVFNSPWSTSPGIIRLRATGGLSADEASRRLLNGELNKPYILETSSERCLHFTPTAVQSRMRLKDPVALVNDYTRKMMAFLLFCPDPAHLVMVGLGGGSIPKFCFRHLPAMQITAIEIDADVIALRDEFCIPVDDARFRIVHADGAKAISRLPLPADVILVDAFDPQGVAPGLAKSDFYARAAASLTENGVLAINLSGREDRFAPHLDRVRDAFEGNVLLVPVPADDNQLLFAFKGPVPLSMASDLKSRAQVLKARLGLDFPTYLRQISRGEILA